MRSECWKTRFWRYVDKRGPNECWPWTANPNPNGYGMLKRAGKRVTASRLSWELASGPIPDGMSVLHRCDNRRCVNPEHLFLGTHTVNMADMMAKGRHARKLTDAEVLAIRGMPGMHKEIAAKFGISRPTVTQIKGGSLWRRLQA